MLPISIETQYVIYRTSPRGKKYHIKVAFDPSSNNWIAIPCTPGQGQQPVEENYFVSLCKDSNPELAKVVTETLNHYGEYTYRTRKRRRRAVLKKE
ncbi:hypothetical protein A2V49_03945 [candidate division WWE3 bacterium RBG_19FT_COMBO_34_6]|uniref:Uncharacterized protein n=1 Tax=candidate division WWE3 bacterium RBG_19FT_COMBO_34_6 TaxID=1802612 RepID=A0A1F4ULR9_UNCKA|nr:MAG: hypothetical protein A2V49_03945 [candidate division WWE3 bacterium RBG_19FT_COMBO_34_6]